MYQITTFLGYLLPMVCIIIGCQGLDKPASTQLQAPDAKKVDHTFREFDNTRIDPYHWLSDPENPEVISLLEAENAFLKQKMSHTTALQEELLEEIIGRIEKKYESLPTKRNGYWYYVRYEAENEYPFYCRKKGSLEAEEEILLNVEEMAKGHDVYRLFSYFVSPDNQMLAYLVDTAGDRRNTLYFKRLDTGEMLPDQIPNCSYSGAWADDNQTFFYTLNDKTVRSYRIMRHQLGSSNNQDVEVFIERDSTFSVGVRRSTDNKFVLIGSRSTTSAEYWFLPANQPKAPSLVIQPRKEGLEYSVDSYTGKAFHIYHNHEAQNFMLSSAPLATPGIANWETIIPHRKDIYLNDYTVKEKYLILQERSKALDQIKVIDRKTKESYYIDFGEEVYTANMYASTDEFTSDSIRYSYQSLTTPSSTFDYNLTSKSRKLLKENTVMGGFKKELYETKRLWVKARDGKEVPMSIVYRKDLFKKDGSNPCLIYSYGSYGASTMPYFRSEVVSLLDRGFVYALAHIRGGQEMGRAWYEDGKLLNKKNTFTDFIDCAQHLVNEGYTNEEKLFAMGASAGGMLMGAITNMRSDLFKGIIALVPWMDVISDMMNEDLPLVTLEYDEWGDPREKTYYDYMLSWSPYDNVEDADFPAILATGGLNDTQVPYFSPAKWVQKVRDHNQGTEPIIFQVEMGAGHGGKSGRFSRQEQTSLIYAFMIDLLKG
ncbi:MAG: S9 family peptidase [Bacteroidota bacterium]